MKRPIDTFLSRLDNSLRWTGIPARVADAMSDDPSVGRHRPLRWISLGPIAYSCTLFLLCLIWPSALMRLKPSTALAIAPSLVLGVVMMLPTIYANGPLGKSSLEDDEREAALRKDSFLFCFGLLACLNCFGQPFLLIVALLQAWQAAQSVSVVVSVLMLNVTLLGCLPTLYASWKLRPLPKD